MNPQLLIAADHRLRGNRTLSLDEQRAEASRIVCRKHHWQTFGKAAAVQPIAESADAQVTSR